MVTGAEVNTCLSEINSDDKTAQSPRRRKKVVTFASMAELAEIQASAASEIDTLCSEGGKTSPLNETTFQPLQDPRLYLNMPLEDYDASGVNVSTALPKHHSTLSRETGTKSPRFIFLVSFSQVIRHRSCLKGSLRGFRIRLPFSKLIISKSYKY